MRSVGTQRGLARGEGCSGNGLGTLARGECCFALRRASHCEEVICRLSLKMRYCTYAERQTPETETEAFTEVVLAVESRPRHIVKKAQLSEIKHRYTPVFLDSWALFNQKSETADAVRDTASD